MKKFNNEDVYSFTPPVELQSAEPKSNNFNLMELLQILPKLNLGGLFKKQNSPSAPAPTQNMPVNIDIMQGENLRFIHKKVLEHQILRDKIMEDNQK